MAARRRARRPQRPRDCAALAARAAPPDGDVTLTLDDLQRRGARSAGRSTTDGDAHYDTISAFIKTHARQRPRCRRLLPGLDARRRRGPQVHRPAHDHLRREDVGNADPQALQVAVAAVARRGVRRACRSAASTSARRRRTWRWRPRATPRTRRSTRRSPTCAREGNQPPPLHLRERQLPGREGARSRRGVQVSARKWWLGRAAVSAGQALRAPLLRADTRVESEWPPAQEETRRRAASGEGDGEEARRT